MKHPIKTTAFAALLISCCLITGCTNHISEEIVKKEEAQTVTVADEFQSVYKQNMQFTIYWHVPTDQMYVAMNGNSLVPMNISYAEYIQKSKEYHEQYDVISGIDTDDSTYR